MLSDFFGIFVVLMVRHVCTDISACSFDIFSTKSMLTINVCNDKISTKGR